MAVRGSFTVRAFHEFTRGWHFHPEIELTAVLASSGRRFVGDHAGDYRPGDLVLVGSNVPHYWVDEPAIPPRARPHSVVIQFRPDCFGEGFWDLPELRPVRRLLDRAGRGLRFGGAARDEVPARMVAMQESGSLDRMLALLGILRDLAAARDVTPLSSPDFCPATDGASTMRIATIHAYISRHYRHRIDHRALAERLDMSSSALSHYVRRTMGCSLSSLVAEIRVGQACRQLILTGKPVAEIAFACGFGGLSSFNAAFRRLRLMSPSQFRRLHRDHDDQPAAAPAIHRSRKGGFPGNEG